jgi:1-acyl-sn-glycerol-3-phosphate acyltransferase
MWFRFILVEPIGLAIARKKKYSLKHTGGRNAPRTGPFIVVSNHQTKVDVFAIGLAIRRVLAHSQMLPWAKVEVGKGREGLLGFILWRYLGVISIDRTKDAELDKAVRKSLRKLKKGKIIFIHPEATRYETGELGPFRFGIANLARAVPVPILPVAIWNRPEDGGIQVNVGTPFYMSQRDSHLDPKEFREEDALSRQIENLREWASGLQLSFKGMKIMARMMDMVLEALARRPIDFTKYCRMADPEDNEFIRDKVFELLPPGWKKFSESESRYREQAKADHAARREHR